MNSDTTAVDAKVAEGYAEYEVQKAAMTAELNEFLSTPDLTKKQIKQFCRPHVGELTEVIVSVDKEAKASYKQETDELAEQMSLDMDEFELPEIQEFDEQL